jgi:hypothetical protein
VPIGNRQQDPDDRRRNLGERAGPTRSAPTDAATRQRALQLIADAEATGRSMTGAELGRAIGRSDRYGRLPLREFPTTTTTTGTGDNGESPR